MGLEERRIPQDCPTLGRCSAPEHLLPLRAHLSVVGVLDTVLVLQAVVSRFGPDEVLGAPLFILRAWLQGRTGTLLQPPLSCACAVPRATDGNAQLFHPRG